MAEVLPGPGARAPPSLPIHLIEEILVWVASPGDLVRASAACTSFRRIVTDASFLRRYRSLHPPLLLGVVGPGGPWSFLPAEAPHPNALAARAFASAADFSFDYLPRRAYSDWFSWDCEAGRVLLMLDAPAGLDQRELTVCDPLTREYTLLPPIPDGLTASTLDQVSDEEHRSFDASFDAFLVPSGDYEDTQFRVICWMHCNTRAAAFVYSSVSSGWTGSASTYWDALGFPGDEDFFLSTWPKPSYAYGCFYWKFNCNKLLKLDINRMEFSAIGLPQNHTYSNLFVFEAEGGRIGMLKHTPESGNPEPLLYSIMQNLDEYVNGLQVETTIPLPSDYDDYSAVGAEGYIFLIGSRTDMTIKSAVFSFDIKTLKIERVCMIYYSGSDDITSYFGFPPFMSPKRI